jgi:hypothetical protein
MHVAHIVVLVCLGAAPTSTACVRPRADSICPEERSLQSSIASQTNSDTGVVTGRVVSVALEPLAGSHVTLSPLGQRMETRADGTFRFERLSPGSYTVSVRRTGFGSARQVLRIMPHSGAQVTATLGVSVISLTEQMP